MVGFQGVLVGCVFLLLFHSAFQQQQQQSRLSSPQEFQALLRLRSSLGIRSREWPIKADPCTIWVGVECRNGSVFSINVSGFRRTRIGSQNPQFAVDALANFTRLASFNASSFSLPGSIPNWLGLRLSSLQILDLSSCNIVGEIPFTVGNLSSLTALYLSGNALNGSIPSALGQLSRLSFLDLSRNSLTGLIPSALGGQLSRLSVLDVSHNSLTGLIPLSLGALGNVSRLDLSSNYLSGTIPTAFGNLSRLQSLNLSGNSLSGSIPPQLGDLSSLVDLDLSSNSFSGSVPSDLGGLRSLQGMVIGNNLLTGSLPGGLFSSLNQLQVVGLNHNNFTGELPGALWSMPGLRILDASDNNFTGLLPNISFNPNSSAATLNLSHNLFYGGIGSVLRRFSSVDLTDNYIEGTIPDYASNIALLSSNCLRNVASQKNVSQCAAFYAERGLPYDGLLPNGTEPIARNSHKSSRRWIILAAAIAGAVVFAFVVTMLFLCTRKRATTTQRGVGVGPVPTTVGAPPPPGVSLNLSSLGEAFTYQQILAAAGEFGDDNLVKHGHSGDIFRGVLEGGIPIIIKRIDVRNVKKDNYMLELDFFSKISHPRLVPLLGHCLENENEKFLVYKYMPYMDLSSSLYRKNNSDDDALQSLDWITRLKIAIGAAEGLSYLHHECTPPLVHRDVQASSILLDDKFEVRLGSLSEVCTQEGETHSNRFTRMLRLPQTSEQGASGTSTATCAYDVYCFGKVLLELVTGKLGLSASSDPTTKDMLEQTLPFISIYDKELVTNIVDPSLIIDEDLLEEVWAMAVVARSCLNPKPSRRPLMRYILKALENPLKVVREETTSSARLRTTSSRGSWNAALFGSWRQSSSDVAAMPVNPMSRGEGTSSFKQSGTTGSQGSGHNGDHSSSTRRHSKDIFPEPLDEQDVERQREG